MASSLRRNVDFTKGNIYKGLLLFAIPIMLGEVFQNLYHSTDSVVLGNFVGDSALAAVSVCGTLTNLLVGFCNGISVGSTVVVSKAFGSGNKKRLEDSIRYTYSFAILMGALLSVVGFVLAPMMVRISNVNEDIYPHALMYLRIYNSGLLFTIVYNNSAGILRGMGDMRTPFVILLISSSLNIVLDLLFSAVLDMGIAGVSIATVISQFVSVIISYWMLHKKLGFRCIDIKDTVRNGGKVIAEAMDVGVSAGVQGSLISFSNLFVWRYINRFSTAAVAGVGIAQRVDKLVSLPTTAFGTATTTFVGQNLGAQNHPRVREGVRDAMILSLSITIVLGILIYPVTGWLASLFNRNPEVISVASAMCRTLIPFYFISAIRQVLMGLLRAHGRSKMNTALTLAGMVGMRQIFLAVTMSIRSDIVFIYYGYPVGWLFAGLFVGVYYLICRKSIMQLPARRTRAAKAAVLGANEENKQESEQDS